MSRYIARCLVWGSFSWGAGLAWSQASPVAENNTPPPAPSGWMYSLGAKLEMGDLRRLEGLKLRPTLGLRYGRWRMGTVDSQTWPSFGQALQDSNLTYDWLKNSQWQTALSASVVNLDQDRTFDALRSGRKTLRAKAALNYTVNKHWMLGLNVSHDLLKRGDGSTLSPTLTYLQTLDQDSAWLLSAFTTWGTAAHWQSEAARTPGSALRQDAGLGSWGTQITYRQRWSPQWAFFTQIGTGRLIAPTAAANQTLGWSGQLGVLYFSH